MDIDTAIAAGLGHFFAAKFRAGILFGIFKQSGDRKALELSIDYYHKARNYWIDLAEIAKDVYKHDITVSELDVLRGHWLDRLPAIDKDIDFMKTLLEKIPDNNAVQPDNVKKAIAEALGQPHRDSAVCNHKQPENFKVGKPVNLEISFEKKDIKLILLYYRHVNHAERFKSVEMQKAGKNYKATIPADYTNTQYPIQYYFELRDKLDNAWLYPGLTTKLMQQPYYVIRKA